MASGTVESSGTVKKQRSPTKTNRSLELLQVIWEAKDSYLKKVSAIEQLISTVTAELLR